MAIPRPGNGFPPGREGRTEWMQALAENSGLHREDAAVYIIIIESSSIILPR